MAPARLTGVDLFGGLTQDGTPEVTAHSPLAVRMRPTGIEEIAGQAHLLEEGSPLRQLLSASSGGRTGPSSVILWGPPGTGKTTLAYLIAALGERHFVELSAVTAGVKDVRDVVAAARQRLAMTGVPTVLFIDEVHRFSATQQDSLLPAVENRWVTLVAATTANPSFAINAPLLSRSLLLTLQPLSDDDIKTVVERAVTDERGLGGSVSLTEEGLEVLVRLAASDARKALTILEAAAGSGVSELDGEAITGAVDMALVRYDRAGDQHYDVASAFIKSMRGSDVDASLHYLARMITAGEDPRFIARRIVIAASEEVGLADPTALHTAVAAAQAVQMIGMPEARIILSQAVIHIATAPKSNAAYLAIDEAIADVKAGKAGPVPIHLRDTHYAGAERIGHGEGYQYAHNAPHAIAPQRYAPDGIDGATYYRPTDRGGEKAISARLAKIREHLAGGLE